MENTDLEISPRQLSSILQVGSDLARRASELWNGDLNAALALVRRYDFDVTDRLMLDEENETDANDD